MRTYLLISCLLTILAYSLGILVAKEDNAKCLDLNNIALVDPIVERLAIKQYPNDIVKQRRAIARWDSVRRTTKDRLSAPVR